jgi:hypothetical protein
MQPLPFPDPRIQTLAQCGTQLELFPHCWVSAGRTTFDTIWAAGIKGCCSRPISSDMVNEPMRRPV